MSSTSPSLTYASSVSPLFDPENNTLPEELLYYLDDHRLQLDDISCTAPSDETFLEKSSSFKTSFETSKLGRRLLTKSNLSAFMEIMQNTEITPLKTTSTPTISTSTLHLSWNSALYCPHLLPSCSASPMRRPSGPRM